MAPLSSVEVLCFILELRWAENMASWLAGSPQGGSNAGSGLWSSRRQLILHRGVRTGNVQAPHHHHQCMCLGANPALLWLQEFHYMWNATILCMLIIFYHRKHKNSLPTCSSISLLEESLQDFDPCWQYLLLSKIQFQFFTIHRGKIMSRVSLWGLSQVCWRHFDILVLE